MRNPKISIVVPIYNMERYLPRCLDSLLSQTHGELEVIAVNDGSTDGSLTLLAEYAGRDPRLTIIDVPNGGVACARTTGLRRCTGDYIGFVDPDDWIHRRMYAELLDAAQREDADIVMCAYVSEFGGFARPKRFDMPDYVAYRGDEVRLRITNRLLGPIGDEVSKPEHLDAWGTVWNKLYRAELLDGIAFTDLALIGSNEDTLFNLSVCTRARSFVFLNRPYYHYWRANEQSITTRYKPDLAGRFLNLYGCLESAYLDNGGSEDEQSRQRLSNRIAMNVLGLGLNIVSGSNPSSMRGKLRELRQLLRHETYSKALLRFRSGPCPPHWRLFYRMAGMRLTLPVFVMLIAMEAVRTKKPIGRNNRETTPNSAGRYDHESRRAGDDAHELLPTNAGERHSI